MAVIGVIAARERLHKHEYEAPNSDNEDESIVQGPKGLMLIKDSAIKEENTEFDAAVSELLDYPRGPVDLSRCRSQSTVSEAVTMTELPCSHRCGIPCPRLQRASQPSVRYPCRALLGGHLCSAKMAISPSARGIIPLA